MKTIYGQALRISGCTAARIAYTAPMRKKWNFGLWLSLAALTVTVTGCGGLSATKTVSPASFFLPGLLHNTIPAQETPSLTEPLPAEVPAHNKLEPVLLADAQY